LLSVFVSGVQEITVLERNSRAAFLRKAIKRVLDDPLNKNFGDLLYHQPTIDGLSMPDNRMPSYIESGNFAKSVFNMLNQEGIKYHYEQDPKTGKMTYKVLNKEESDSSKFFQGIESLNESNLKSLLQSFATNSNSLETETEKYQAIIKNLEDWYNGYMDRVTGWYKKEVKKSLFLKSLIIALLLNVNFFSIIKTLYTNTALRDTLVNGAVAASENKSKVDAKKALDSLYYQGLPIGWDTSFLTETESIQVSFAELVRIIKSSFQTVGQGLYFLLGVLISAYIMSFGAPFWFDVLNKIVNMRKAGINSNILKNSAS
jgi:hypothetical protein